MKSVLMVMYGRSVGGAEMQFIELANYLAKRHKVTLISLGGDGCIKSSYLDGHIEVKSYPYVHGKKGAIYPMLIKAVLENRHRRFDAVVATSFYGDLIGLLLSFRSRSTQKLSLQTVSKCMQNPKIDSFVLRHYDHLVAGAGDIREYLLGHGQDDNRISVIHNWVDFSARTVSQTASQVKAHYGIEGKQVIGCVGRLHSQKGQVFLIRAFALIKDKVPNYVLVLVGEGPERETLQSEVERLGFENRTYFLGGVSGADYNNVMSAIDIYVQPSIFEGLPRTVLDAMYLGRPIIATDANGNREAIKHGVNGYLVPPQNPEVLAQAIIEMAMNPDMCEALSKQAKQDVMIGFDMQNQLRKIEELF